jgi:putative PIN family toxin of toxin-antitoxin system
VRAVLDLNVYVSALINPTGTPAQVVRFGLQRRYEIVVSPALLTELAEVLDRPAFRRYFTADEAAEFIGAVAGASDEVDDPSAVEPVSRDADDDYLVVLARDAGADRLVTGDPDLLEVVGPPVPIVSPGVFVAELLGG